MTDLSRLESMLQSLQEEERLQALKSIARCDGGPEPRLLYLALGDPSWRIRKEAAEIFLSLPRSGELAGEVIELLHSQDNAGLRNTAVEILISLGRRATPYLLEEVACNDHDVRKFVLDILGEIRDPDAVTAMVGALSDPDGNVRAAAAENLGKIGSPAAVPALLEGLGHSDLLFRFTVLEALGQIGTEVPVETLLAFREEKLLRKALFDCLGRIGAVAAIPVLVEGLVDPMRNVREAAASALDRISRHRPQEVEKHLAATAGGAVPEALAGLFESGHLHVRRAALRLLGLVGDGRFVPQLIGLFSDPDVRESTLSALISLGRTASCSLIQVWDQSDSPTRACLAFIMGEARCDGAESLLLEGVKGTDPELRLGAAQALGKLGGARAIHPLAHLLGDDSEDVRHAACEALTRIGPHHPDMTFSALQSLIQGDDPGGRMFAVRAAAALSGGEVDAALALAMKDESSQVRQAAISACEGRAGSRHLPALRLALTDEDADVRQRAVEVIGSTDDPEAIRALQSALQDEDIWVRTGAVRAIGRLGGDEAIQTVVTALSDPVGLVTIAALEVLCALDAEAANPHLEQALQHPDEEVVNAALGLLAASGRTAWIPTVSDRLINHHHWDVRMTFARTMVHLMGSDCRNILQARLLVEGEDLVRQNLQEMLDGLLGEGRV